MQKTAFIHAPFELHNFVLIMEQDFFGHREMA